MNLESYAQNGWIAAQATSPDEIKSLLALVARGIADSKVEAISADLRFIAAFSAALTAATIALRACGYRTKSQTGHHQRTIESLEFTIGADSKLISKMRTFSNKRNATSYDAAGNVSRQELELVVKVAEQLQNDVIAWLRTTHAQLL